jgi:voltage-gated potassium channel Kch
MLVQIGFGIAMLAATTFVHSGATWECLSFMKRLRDGRPQLTSMAMKAGAVAYMVTLLFVAAVIESALWAAAYVWMGALESFEEAMYFSTVTFTTLGFGDVTLAERWRLVSAFEAANGTMLFGWSTALIFAVVQRIIEARKDEGSAE